MVEFEIETIGFNKLWFRVLNICWIVMCLSFYTYASSLIPNRLVSESKTFLAYIIVGWILLIPKCIDVSVIINHYGQTMDSRRYNIILPSNRYPLLILKLLQIVDLILMTCIMSYFSPINKSNCGIYDDFPTVCDAMRLITIFGYILWSFYAMLVLLLCCLIPFSFLCVTRDDTTNADLINNQNNQGNYGAQIRRIPIQILRSYLPISFDPPHDKTCAICCQDAEDGDKWMELPCKHIFHQDCVEPWLHNHSGSCPLCREDISRALTLPGEVSVTVM